MNNIFKLIKEPKESPNDLLDSYRQQNILMQKIRLLHTAFDGIKLNHWRDGDRELPDILAGSVCEFEGRLFETNQTIKLTDNNVAYNDLRYIKLVIVRDNNDSDNDYLIAEVASGNSSSENFPAYDYENRGFYVKKNNVIKEKYLRISMKYNQALGGYVQKKYWNISDTMRAGIIYKRQTVRFGVGNHTFNVPDNVDSVTVHICSGGGGGSHSILTESISAKNGGDSEIIVNNKTITTCRGGKLGTYSGWTPIAGVGGKASGKGKLINGIDASGVLGAIFYTNNTMASGGNGGDGGKGSTNNAPGGGSGSAAIVEITRAMLGSSTRININVGAGGAGGINPPTVHQEFTHGKAGQDGSAFIEYFTRG